MATGYVLYNEKAGNNEENDYLDALDVIMGEELKRIEVSTVKDYASLFAEMGSDDYLILAGGDGTLNRFINNTADLELPEKVLYYPIGTGNDFAADLGYEKGCNPFPIREYLQNLPTVTVKEKTYRFLNGVGYGIDGYCCEVGDKLKATPGKKVNYTKIAIEGLLFHFKPVSATVTVDGVNHSYQKVWLAPAMHGRMYGGGMIPTPDQKRNSGMLSAMVFHGTGKLKTLMIFPNIFKGTHVAHKEAVEVLRGKEITVSFSRPTALQIDGETLLNVTSYTAKA